jgi:hypothetical protein
LFPSIYWLPAVGRWEPFGLTCGRITVSDSHCLHPMSLSRWVMGPFRFTHARNMPGFPWLVNIGSPSANCNHCLSSVGRWAHFVLRHGLCIVQSPCLPYTYSHIGQHMVINLIGISFAICKVHAGREKKKEKPAPPPGYEPLRANVTFAKFRASRSIRHVWLRPWRNKSGDCTCAIRTSLPDPSTRPHARR